MSGQAHSDRVPAWQRGLLRFLLPEERSPIPVGMGGDGELAAGHESWREEPQWLELSLDKRAAALKRMAVVKRYLAGKRSAAAADEMAAELQIGRSRFYDLCRAWEKTRSPLPLAPFKDPVVPQRPSVRRERAEEIRAKVDAVLAGTPDRTPGKIVAAVAKTWGDGTAPPSRDTLRRFVEQAIAKSQEEVEGTLRREGTEVARAFGEVVVVDHTVVDIFASDDGAPIRPTLTLAIDLLTGAPVGHSVHLALPNPEMVVAALRDAQRRTAALGGVPVRPRIVLASTYSSEWTSLVRDISAAGIVVTGRRTAQLPFGAPTARLIGGRLGRLRLLARAGHEPAGLSAGFDPGAHPVLTIQQARAVVLANVAQELGARLGRTGGQRLVFDFLRDGDGGAA